MKTNVLRGTTLVALVVLLCSFNVPKNWFAAGNEPDSYRMGTDPTVTMNGRHAATIQSIEPEIDGFGTLMQQCLPSEYAGKRVRMSGYMKSQDVAGWAGFWFRVDGQGARPLAFDNMHWAGRSRHDRMEKVRDRARRAATGDQLSLRRSVGRYGEDLVQRPELRGGRPFRGDDERKRMGRIA